MRRPPLQIPVSTSLSGPAALANSLPTSHSRWPEIVPRRVAEAWCPRSSAAYLVMHRAPKYDFRVGLSGYLTRGCGVDRRYGRRAGPGGWFEPITMDETREVEVRKVVSGLFISLDGVVESPDKWQFDVFDDDMMAAMTSHIAQEDTVLLGRVTYQDWAGYWPTSKDEPYASHINNTPKYVASTTLKEVEWMNSTLIKGPLADQVRSLKQESGGNIGVSGSPSVVRSLLQDGLLDELTLMIHPVVVGGGKRLFLDGMGLKRLHLVRSKMTQSGVAILTYQPHA